MSTNLYVSEHVSLEAGVPTVPAPANQTLKIGDKSVASARFDPATRFIRVLAAADCWISFDIDPVASSGTMHLLANVPETFGVPRGGAPLRLAVVA